MPAEHKTFLKELVGKIPSIPTARKCFVNTYLGDFEKLIPYADPLQTFEQIESDSSEQCLKETVYSSPRDYLANLGVHSSMQNH